MIVDEGWGPPSAALQSHETVQLIVFQKTKNKSLFKNVVLEREEALESILMLLE